MRFPSKRRASHRLARTCNLTRSSTVHQRSRDTFLATDAPTLRPDGDGADRHMGVPADREGEWAGGGDEEGLAAPQRTTVSTSRTLACVQNDNCQDIPITLGSVSGAVGMALPGPRAGSWGRGVAGCRTAAVPRSDPPRHAPTEGA